MFFQPSDQPGDRKLPVAVQAGGPEQDDQHDCQPVQDEAPLLRRAKSEELGQRRQDRGRKNRPSQAAPAAEHHGNNKLIGLDRKSVV